MGLLGYPLQGQELDTVILRGPCHVSILYDSVQHGKGGLLLAHGQIHSCRGKSLGAQGRKLQPGDKRKDNMLTP